MRLDLFLFNQPLSQKTCGARCLSAILNMPGYDLMNRYPYLIDGLYFLDIIRIFKNHAIKYYKSIPSDKGSYFVLYDNSPTSVHYVLYVDGVLYDSLEKHEIRLSLEELQNRLEDQMQFSVESMFLTLRIE